LTALALLVVVSACSEPRMSLDAWEQVWEQTVDRIAEIEADEIPEEECTEVLAYLREQRPRLKPLPADGLEKPVNSWFELAQAAFFECPPDGEKVKGWSQAFEQLRVIEAEVRTVLARQP
jgi:hypothetical protein